MSYAQGLAEYGFNFHSVIRPQYKINYKRLDYYMNNLVKSKKVDVAFACIEPDIDKYTFKLFTRKNKNFCSFILCCFSFILNY